MQEQEPLMNGHNGNANNADSISMLTGSQQDSLSQLGLGTLGGLGGGPTTIGGALVPEDYHWDTSDWEPHPEMEPLHPQHRHFAPQIQVRIGCFYLTVSLVYRPIRKLKSRIKSALC